MCRAITTKKILQKIVFAKMGKFFFTPYIFLTFQNILEKKYNLKNVKKNRPILE